MRNFVDYLFAPSSSKWYNPLTWCDGLFVLFVIFVAGIGSLTVAAAYLAVLAARYVGLI